MLNRSSGFFEIRYACFHDVDRLRILGDVEVAKALVVELLRLRVAVGERRALASASEHDAESQDPASA